MQMLISGAVLVLIGSIGGAYGRVDWDAISAEAWWAMVWLVLAGSVIAFSAYAFALAELPLPVVSTYAYVNPVVAVLLGALFLQRAPHRPRADRDGDRRRVRGGGDDAAAPSQPLAGLDRRRDAIALRGERALPARVVAAGRVIGEVQVEHERGVRAAEIGALGRVEQVPAGAVGRPSRRCRRAAGRRCRRRTARATTRPGRRRAAAPARSGAGGSSRPTRSARRRRPARRARAPR